MKKINKISISHRKFLLAVVALFFYANGVFSQEVSTKWINVGLCSELTPELKFNLFNDNNNGSDWWIQVEAPANFTLELGGDFYSTQIPGVYETKKFFVGIDGLWGPSLRGHFSPNADATFIVKIYNGTNLTFSLLIPYTAPINIVLPSPTNISDLYGSPGDPLLSPAQAASTAQKIRIDGTLIIDQNYTFGGSIQDLSEIEMAEGAAIIVDMEVTLNLPGARLFGCTDNWEGITVYNGGGIRATFASIANANTAITIGEEGDIFVGATHFLNNTVGINKLAIPLGGPSSFVLNNYGNVFEINDQYFGGGSDTKGIAMEDFSSFTSVHVFGPAFTIHTSSFIGMDVGVELKNGVSTSILGTLFENIDKVGLDLDHVVDNDLMFDEFENVRDAVKLNNSSFTFLECAIGASLNGIIATDDTPQNYFILDCPTLRSEGTNISINSLSNSFGLIRLNNFFNDGGGAASRFINVGSLMSGELRIYDNLGVHSGFYGNGFLFNAAHHIDCKGNNLTFDSPARVGIELRNSFGATLENNSVSGNLQRGIYLRDSNFSYLRCNTSTGAINAFQVSGDCSMSEIIRNEWSGIASDMTYGFNSFNNFAVTGPQPLFLDFYQNGNAFKGTSRVIHHGGISQAAQSIYKAKNTSATTNGGFFLPSSVSPSSWFDNSLVLYVEEPCSVEGEGEGESPSEHYENESALDHEITNGAFNNLSLNYPGQLWDTKLNAYSRLRHLAEPSFEMQNWLNDQGNQDLEVVSNIQTAFSGNPESRRADFARIEALYDRKLSFLSELKDELDSSTSLEETELILENHFSELKGQYEEVRNFNANRLAGQNSLVSNATFLLSDFSNTSENNRYINFETAYSSLLAVLQGNQLNETALNDLTSLAASCAEESGASVYLARAIHENILKQAVYLEEIECEENLDSRSKENTFTTTGSQFKVVNTLVENTLVIDNPTSATIKVCIFDQLSNVLSTLDVVAGFNEFSVNLNSGLYFVASCNEFLSAERIVVVH